MAQSIYVFKEFPVTVANARTQASLKPVNPTRNDSCHLLHSVASDSIKHDL